MDFIQPAKANSFVTKVLQVRQYKLRRRDTGEAVMARTKARNRTAEQQAAWEAQQAADAWEAAARRARAARVRALAARLPALPGRACLLLRAAVGAAPLDEEELLAALPRADALVARDPARPVELHLHCALGALDALGGPREAQLERTHTLSLSLTHTKP